MTPKDRTGEVWALVPNPQFGRPAARPLTVLVVGPGRPHHRHNADHEQHAHPCLALDFDPGSTSNALYPNLEGADGAAACVATEDAWRASPRESWWENDPTMERLR